LFSPVTLVSSTNKTDCHDIAEILLKVALNTIDHLSALSHMCYEKKFEDTGNRKSKTKQYNGGHAKEKGQTGKKNIIQKTTNLTKMGMNLDAPEG
jgi:hypothetical protein